ncbi:MAG: cysteine--tRNA ligase [Alphaproteobacteria bacterium]|nr:cysteine--tRNA ligase [Alphaproteobacteria bacterium]
MKLFNSLSGKKETFAPSDPNRVTMYVCGPTVYDYAHIGNARPAVVFDVLFRVLCSEFGHVVYARNITDIDDKIIKAAAESAVPIDEITSRYTRAYNEDMAALNVLPPTIEPMATGHVDGMLSMIADLIDKGAAYEADGHVLFHVPACASYGALSKRSREDMIDGARVEVAPYKRDPADFVLWKPSTPEQPGWDGPYGRGRPGWHTECAVMIKAHLGETIDIHGGGQDLKFPHHENELAQSLCAHDGAPLARFWLHNGFLDVEEEKMSKSIGNVLLPHDLIKTVPGEAIRYALLSAHYRKPLNWTPSGLSRAKHALDRLYRTLAALPGPNEAAPDAPVPAAVRNALLDDINTPIAQAALFKLMQKANSTDDQAEKTTIKRDLLAAGRLLGLLQRDPESWLQSAGQDVDVDRGEIERLLERRRAARASKDFETADQIRDQLEAEGVLLEDGPDGTRWRLG